MDLRNLAFRVAFEGSASPILQMDGATNDLKKSVSGATGELDNMGKTLRHDVKTESIDKLDRSTEKLGKTTETTAKKGRSSIESVQKKLSSFQKSAGESSKKLMKGITLPLVGLATAGVKMAMDLDVGVRKISTLADRDILPVAKIQEEVRLISDASGIAQTEIAEATYSALSAGVKSEEVFSFVSSSIDLVKAGFTDMDTAIDATTSILNAYGEEAYGVSTIHDMLVQTQDKGKITVDELGKNMGRVIPTAASLGVNLDQLGASYAILTSKGQPATLATTNLNAMLGELGKSGSVTDKILRDQTGKGFRELTKEGKTIGEVLKIVDEQSIKTGKSLKDMFGSDTAGSAAVSLISGGEEGSFDDYVGLMNDAEGKTKENAEAMSGSLQKVKEAANSLKNSLTDVGAVIAPTVEIAAVKIKELVDTFNGLDKGAQSSVLAFVGLAAAAGPALWVVTKLVGIIKFLLPIGAKVATGIGVVTAFLGKAGFAISAVAGGAATLGEGMLLIMGPVGWVIAGFAALVVAGTAVYKNWGKISEWGRKWWSEQKEGWEKAKNNTINAWKGMQEGIGNQIEKIKEWGRGLKDFFKDPIKGTVEIAQNFNQKYNPFSKTNRRVDGSNRDGLDKVPFDGYVSELHQDEMVLTKSTSDKFRALGGTKDNVPNVSKTVNASNSSVTNSQPVTNTYNDYTEKEKTIEKVDTQKEQPSISFNPVYNIEISGTATETDKQDFEKVAKKVTREMFNEFFKEMNMKLA